METDGVGRLILTVPADRVGILPVVSFGFSGLRPGLFAKALVVMPIQLALTALVVGGLAVLCQTSFWPIAEPA